MCQQWIGLITAQIWARITRRWENSLTHLDESSDRMGAAAGSLNEILTGKLLVEISRRTTKMDISSLFQQIEIAIRAEDAARVVAR
jgi:hypothetical protein